MGIITFLTSGVKLRFDDFESQEKAINEKMQNSKKRFFMAFKI
jgi:hypothetical protein